MHGLRVEEGVGLLSGVFGTGQALKPLFEDVSSFRNYHSTHYKHANLLELR